MRIVGFRSDKGLRLGIVENDEVIDLQAVDPGLPNDLGVVLRRFDGDLVALKAVAGKAPCPRGVPSPDLITRCRWRNPERSSASA